MMVILRSRIVRARTVGWRLVGYVTLAPLYSTMNSPPICSYMWLRGSTDRSRLEGLQTMYWDIPSMFAVRFRWVIITPFGSPVVPEVNMISARSSGAMSTCSGWGRPWIAASNSSKVISGTPRFASSLGVNRDVKAIFGSILDMTLAT